MTDSPPDPAATSADGSTPAPDLLGTSPGNLPMLQREVLRPTSDRGRLAALATICSLAGVALGFALAGTMFASIPVAARISHTPCGHHHRIEATPAWIGVGVRSDGPATGAWVRTVRPGSPASASLMQPGDVIVAVDGERIATSDDLVAAVRSRASGSQIRLTYKRADLEVVQALVLEPMPYEIWRAEQRLVHRRR